MDETKDIYDMDLEEIDFAIKYIQKQRSLFLEMEMALVSYREYYKEGNEQGMASVGKEMERIEREVDGL